MQPDQEQDAKKAAVPATTPPATAEPATAEGAATPSTTFTTAGKIPPVAAATAPKAASPTASQMAYGAGVQALTALIAKGGKPDPKAVVKLIDAHSTEHDAMMTLVEQKLGDAYVAEVKGAMGLRASSGAIRAGDPGDPKAASFVASAADTDMKWRTADGGFTGSVDGNGLDTSVALGSNDTLHATSKAGGATGGATPASASGATNHGATLDWNHDGKTEVEAYGNYKDATDYGFGVNRAWGVGPGQLTTGLDHSVASGTATDGVVAGYKTTDGKVSGKAEVGLKNGQLAESAQAEYDPTKDAKITGNVAHDSKGTTGQLAGSYSLNGGDEKLNASVGRSAVASSSTASGGSAVGGAGAAGAAAPTYKWSAEADATEKLSNSWSLNQKVTETFPQTGSATTVADVGETYKSGSVAESATVEGGTGKNPYLKGTAEVDEHLGGGFYASEFGNYTATEGKANVGSAGVGLTFTPDEQHALTLAGLVDQNGGLEMRLQADVFKSKIDSVSALDDNKKKAVLSAFISYKTDGGNRNADNIYGTPDMEEGGSGQVSAGLSLRF